MTQQSYYRSLEQMADTPEFQVFAAEEFPGFANVYESLGEAEPKDDDPEAAGLNRRKFLALSAAALGLAGLAGCRRPDIQILPFAVVPDEQVGHVVHGKPTFYATSIPRAGGALPILVESHDGRPTKIEGNPQHPCSLGSTDAHAQASILDLYSPDRVMSEKFPGVMEGRAPRKWEDFDRFARGEAEKLAKDKGKGFFILTEQTTSPAMRELRKAMQEKYPNASWYTYEPTDLTEAIEISKTLFNSPAIPHYRFDKAERILALDSDFLGNEPDSVLYSRGFAKWRKPEALSAEAAGRGIEHVIHLNLDEKGHVLWVVPPDQDTGAKGYVTTMFDRPVQVELFLQRRAKDEKAATGKEKPRSTVIICIRNTPTEIVSEVVKGAKAAGFEDVRTVDASMNRLYVVESTYTVTGTMADHRLRLPALNIGEYLVAVARELQSAHAGKLKRKPIAFQLPAPRLVFDPKWVKAVAKDLADHAGKCLVVVGPRQPDWVQMLGQMVNEALGNFAAGTVEFRIPPVELLDGDIKGLVAAMAAGKVSTLLIVGGNPVFNAPADLRFADELQKVPKKIRLGLFHDHTSEKCDWHLPLAHFLEGWGDTEASDGSLCCVQPLIAPLNSGKSGSDDVAPPARGGRTVLEVLSLLTQVNGPDGKPVGSFGAAQKAAYGFVRKAFSERSGIALTDAKFDLAFNRYKQVGFFPVDADKAKALGFEKPGEKVNKPAQGGVAIQTPRIVFESAPTKDSMEVTFHPSYAVGDGRFAMNPWLQEMPDPITKIVWDNAAVISPATATEFGVKQGDLVEVSVAGKSVTLPAFVLPGQADYSIALAFGQYGEMRIAHVPQGGGTNVFPIRFSNIPHIARGSLKKTGGKGDLVTTQEHGVIPEGRDIIREATPAPHAHSHDKHDTHSVHGPLIGIPPDGHITEEKLKKEFQGGYGNPQQGPAPVRDKQNRFPLDLARPELLDSQFQWGMVIDLSTCTGCSACMIACQAENNIPVVGKHEVKRNREMHWIRLDRYFTGPTDDPRIVSQPLACVQCEAAPCEQVCPVNAALHSPEGLNLQVYNRCIGTRYCSNACPYKVRRFNWFDFNKRRLDELRVPTPFASGGTSFSESGVPETLKMQKNPDVTVRMRGVMEKCTYCVQRLERGKFGAKIAATEVAQDRRTIETDPTFKTADGSLSAYKKPKNPLAAGYDLDALGRVIVPDGIIVTACQAACPSQAITFGNALDPTSKVSKLKAKESEYLLLGELNTKPRTSYLPRVRNLNPEMLS